MLTRDQTVQYERDGYTLFPDFLSPDEVAALLSDIESICAGNTLAKHDKSRLEMEPSQLPDGTRVRRVYEPCTYYPRFRALAESERLLQCVEELLGSNLLFHYSKINMKPPVIGSVVEWHQDIAYYPLTNHDSVAVLFYLDDATSSNGCLQVIPGCQRAPLMNHTRDGFFQGRITDSVDTSRAVYVDGKAGSAILMHCMTPHSSTTNTSGLPRRTLILSYRAADAFPIYAGPVTLDAEAHVRLVRGQQLNVARFSVTQFPIPKQQHKTASLYELQEVSRLEGKRGGL